MNIFGEALDLAAGGLLHPSLDPEKIAGEVVRRYEELWHEITYEEVVGRDDRHYLDKRIRRLNELGFDVAEVTMSSPTAVPRTRSARRWWTWATTVDGYFD